jgi:predicted SAM-dependent methyltransferase
MSTLDDYSINLPNSENKSFLNIGCGDRYKKGWVNIDFVSSSQGVLKHDLTKPLPFSDDSFDFVYSSHVLEHFGAEDALKLLVEMRRVLRVGGVCRVVVPDLESAAIEYLRVLSDMNYSSRADQMKYEWSVIELIDQFTRVDFGGEMIKYLKNPNIDREYIEGRIGSLKFISNIGHEKPSFIRRLRSKSLRAVMKKINQIMLIFLVNVLGGRVLGRSFKEAIFRSYGEVHRSAWDKVSLKKLFIEAGFNNPKHQGANQSESNVFLMQGLDFDVDSMSIYKPNSLYFESIKT